MSKKSILKTFLFIIFFFGEIAFSFSYKSKTNSNFRSSEYIPISHSLDNYYSSHYQTIVIDNYMSEFLNKWDIKGASVAITKDERLVYTKGFGYANKEKVVERIVLTRTPRITEHNDRQLEAIRTHVKSFLL